MITASALIWASESPSFLLPSLSFLVSPCSRWVKTKQGAESWGAALLGCTGIPFSAVSILHRARGRIAGSAPPALLCPPHSWGVGDISQEVQRRAESQKSCSSSRRMLRGMQLWGGERCGGCRRGQGWTFGQWVYMLFPIDLVSPIHYSSCCPKP